MKRITTILLLIFGIGIFYSQENKLLFNIPPRNEYSLKDNKPKIIYETKRDTKKTKISINGKIKLPFETLFSLKQDSVKSVYANKVSDNEEILNVTTRENYEPKLISVKDLLLKYTKLKKTDNFIYSIDENIINADENITLLDEKNIMQIKITTLDKLPNFKNFYLIKLVTRSKKNVEKANEIILR